MKEKRLELMNLKGKKKRCCHEDVLKLRMGKQEKRI